MTQYTGISLFSGAGGMDIGFRDAGVGVLFANELDHEAAETYRANLDPTATVMREGDIKDFMEDLRAYQDVDVLFGGPPCQGFSVAGKMDPSDERSQLVFTFMDAVGLVRPKLFVMENVKALGQLTRWKSVRDRLFDRAQQLGYGTAQFVLNAADFGVPQARERFILIGLREDMGTIDAASLAAALASRRAQPRTVRDALLAVGEDASAAGSTAAIRLAKNPVMRRSPYNGSLLFNGRGRPLDPGQPAKTLPAQMGGNHTPIIDQTLLDDPEGYDWVSDYHARLQEGTVTPEDEQQRIPSSVRRITVREAAALQTFPADYVFKGKQNKQYRQIGNAVPCALARAVAESALGLLPDLLEESA